MRRRLLLVALVVAMLAACGDDSAARSNASRSTDSSPSATVTAGAATPDVLQFTAPLVGGGQLDFTQFTGHTVALWFWAPT